MINELIDELKDIKLAIFDLDGVVYRGFSLIKNLDKNIKALKENSVKIVYNSSNSTITRQIFVDRLKNFGITSEISDFYTSAYFTTAEITKLKKISKIYVIGENGLIEELKDFGHRFFLILRAILLLYFLNLSISCYTLLLFYLPNSL